jgi:hypothetical protein
VNWPSKGQAAFLLQKENLESPMFRYYSGLYGPSSRFCKRAELLFRGGAIFCSSATHANGGHMQNIAKLLRLQRMRRESRMWT